MNKRWKFWKAWKRNRKPWTQAAPIKRAYDAIAEFPRNPDAPLHRLPAPLIISLTSYPARFPWLHLTLRSMFDQTVRPDQIVLWLAHDDLKLMPSEVLAFQGDRFAIKTCDDLRNFKRIVPAMDVFADSFMVFADDDMFYPEEWLQRLVDAYDPRDPSIVCYRASRIRHTSDGRLASYRTWPNASDRRSEIPSSDLLPINQMGVLYPPGSLPPETKDLSLIQKLSATSDEAWLFFMGRLAGWKVRRVSGKMPAFAEWPDSQEEALWKLHRGGKKDEHFQTMAEYFGTP